MTTEQQIATLNQLIEQYRHTCPISYSQIKAIGPDAMREWANRLILRAKEINRDATTRSSK